MFWRNRKAKKHKKERIKQLNDVDLGNDLILAWQINDWYKKYEEHPFLDYFI